MANTESASELYHKATLTLTNYRNSEFYLEREDLSEFDAAFEAMAEFLILRPAMLIDDAQNKDKALAFIEKEWYEAQHAEMVESSDDLFAEIGDTTFFALLAGTIHWASMSEAEKDFVDRSIEWSRDKARENGMETVEAVVYVAKEKDPINYRAEFYQLRGEDESLSEVRSRVVSIGKLHKKIREQLNGTWKGSTNLLETLATKWYLSDPETDIEAFQIEMLFELAGIDLLANIKI